MAEDSIEECRLILLDNVDYLPALKILAEAYYQKAKELFDKELLGCARDVCEEAASTLSK